MIRPALALTLIILAGFLPTAQASNEKVYLPEGEVELTDILSPNI